MANRQRAKPAFKPGLLVMVKDIHKLMGSEGKLAAARTGPWSIVEVHPENLSLKLADAQGDILPRMVPFDQARIMPR